MSLNDASIDLTKAVDIQPGVANPTVSSNYGDPLASNMVSDPGTTDLAAGAGPDFKGDENARRELRNVPGEDSETTLEETEVEPLGTEPGKADQNEAATGPETTEGEGGILDTAKSAFETITK